MFVSKIKTRYRRTQKKRVCQGDILRDIKIVIGLSDFDNHTEINLPYAIVLTQDCDLKNDYDGRSDEVNHDKWIKTILLCPAYPADQFFLGEHIADWKMKIQNQGEADKIKKNDQQKRYHYLEGDGGYSVPNLVIDFKHFYTAPRDLIYKNRKIYYLATINELFREELSQRFANFLSRIGLPEI